MQVFQDFFGRSVRLTEERRRHIEGDHPEMRGQIERIGETLMDPDIIVRSRSDRDVELFFKHYTLTPVSEKYMCVVAKTLQSDAFIVTAYYTDRVKRGEAIWKRKS